MIAPTRGRLWILLAACLLAFVAYVHRAGFATAGTDLKRELGLTDDQWGNIMAAFLVAYALLEIPWGVIGDRWGPRRMLLVAVLGWSALTALTPLVVWLSGSTSAGSGVVTVPALITLRFAFGAFQAGAFPGLTRAMADWMPVGERGRAQGLIWTSSRLGGAVAPFLLGVLVHGLGGWQGGLVAASALGIVWSVAFWPWLHDRPENSPLVNQAELALIASERPEGTGSHRAAPWGAILRSRSVWALCCMYACGGLAASFYITLLPDYLRTHRGFSSAEARWLSALPLACGICGCFLGGAISDRIIRRTGSRRWGRRLIGMVGLACGGAALLATIWVQETWALGALLCAAFFCFDLTMGPAWAACADIGARHAGTLGGAMNMIGNLGAALGAKMAGFLFGKQFGFMAGNDLVFVVFAASFWLGAILWLGVDASRPLSAGQKER